MNASLNTGLSKVAMIFLFAFLSVPGSATAFADDGLGVIAGVSESFGSVGNADQTITSRYVSVTDVHALPGWRFGDFLVGIMGQYRWDFQTSDPNTTGATNVKGHGYYLGVGGAADLGPFDFQASFDFLGSYSMSLPTADGSSSSFSKPIGFTAIAGYRLFSAVSLEGVFGLHGFRTNTVAGNNIGIASDKLTEISYGVGASFHY